MRGVCVPWGPQPAQVVAFLPWLLVSRGRLEHRHLAGIASSRSLGARARSEARSAAV